MQSALGHRPKSLSRQPGREAAKTAAIEHEPAPYGQHWFEDFGGENGESRGHAIAEERPDHVWVHSLEVSDRGQGVGAGLLDHIQRHYKGKPLRLKPFPTGERESDPDEDELRGYYSRRGFTKYHPREGDDWDASEWMERHGAGEILRNPHTKGLTWYHGTRASSQQLAGGFRVGEGDPDPQWPHHWSTGLGVHFAAHHSMANKFADPNVGVGGKGSAADWEHSQTPSVVHARLHIANPRVYHDEDEMADDVFEHEHGERKNYISNYIKADDERVPYAAPEYFSYDHHPDEAPGKGEYEHFDDWADHGEWGEEQPEPVYRREQWLNLHPDQAGIAQRHRERLQAQGHDGIVYANSSPDERVRSSKPESNQVAIAFHPSQIEITKHHVFGDEHKTAAARWSPSSGVFGPTTGHDPRLFDGDKLRPEVRRDVMERLDQALRVDTGVAGSDWQDWLKVYIAGGSASEWAGSRPNDTAQDLDVLVGVNYLEAKRGSLALQDMDSSQIDTALNVALRNAFNQEGLYFRVNSDSWGKSDDHHPSAQSKTGFSQTGTGSPAFPSSTSPESSGSPMTSLVAHFGGLESSLTPPGVAPTLPATTSEETLGDATDAGTRGRSKARGAPTAGAGIVKSSTCATTTWSALSESQPRSTTGPWPRKEAAAGFAEVSRKTPSGRSQPIMTTDAVQGASHAGSAFAGSSATAATEDSEPSGRSTSELLWTTSPEQHPLGPNEHWAGPFNVTGFVNPDAYDITKIKPYAAYNVTDMKWAVKPPHLPEHTLADFDPAVLAVARAVATEARAILRMPEPARTHEARALWERLHSDRRRAFSDEGEGWQDPGNLIEKYLAYAPGKLLERIKELALAKPAATMTASAWSNYRFFTGTADPRKLVPTEHTAQNEKWGVPDSDGRKYLDEVKADIAAHGMQTPIDIDYDKRGRDRGPKPYIGQGHHRHRAAIELGLREVPVSMATAHGVPDWLNNPAEITREQWNANANGFAWGKDVKTAARGDLSDRQFSKLESRLLGKGGTRVVNPGFEPDLDKIMQRGQDWEGADATRKPMRSRDCHANAARLCESGGHQIATGYALSDDGLWRQHSWGIHATSGRPIETTTPREKYHGVVLTADEAAEFGRMNPSHTAAVAPRTAAVDPYDEDGEPRPWHRKWPGETEEDLTRRRGQYIQQVADRHGVSPAAAHKAITQVAGDLGGDLAFTDGRKYGFANDPGHHEIFSENQIKHMMTPEIWHGVPVTQVPTEGLHASQNWLRPRTLAHNLFHPGKKLGQVDDEEGHPDFDPDDLPREEEDYDDIAEESRPRPDLGQHTRFLRRDNGTMMVVDGHHRAAIDMALGKETTPGTVIDESKLRAAMGSPRVHLHGEEMSAQDLHAHMLEHHDRTRSELPEPRDANHLDLVDEHDHSHEFEDPGHEHEVPESAHEKGRIPAATIERYAAVEPELYHGTNKVLAPGDHVVPGEEIGVSSQYSHMFPDVEKFSHATGDRAKAYSYAVRAVNHDPGEPGARNLAHVYRVRPLGSTEDNPMEAGAVRSRDHFEVLEEVPGGYPEGTTWREHVGSAERTMPMEQVIPRKTAAAPSYEIRLDPDYHGRHRVYAWPPGRTGSTEFGGSLGELHWHPEKGYITYLNVPEEHRRKGIATALWNYAQQEAPRQGLRPPEHGESRSADGDAWARSVGGRLPETTASAESIYIPPPLPDEALERAKTHPHQVAASYAQQVAVFDHPRLMMRFPRSHEGGDELVGSILRHTGYEGDTEGAFVSRHPHPENKTSNPAWLGGKPGVTLHPDAWDYRTVAHEAAHHALMYHHAIGPNEDQPDEQVHGPEWAGYYARGLNYISPGAGDDFLSHRQHYLEQIQAHHKTASYQMPNGDVPLGPFYHGTHAELRPGDLIEPNKYPPTRPDPDIRGDDADKPRDHVHFTRGRRDYVTEHYGPNVYEVEPTGTIRRDNEYNDKRMLRSQHPLRVVRQVSHSWGTPVEEDQAKIASSDGDRWVTCEQGCEHWGKHGAAGLLIRHRGEDGLYRYLLQKRSDDGDAIDHPGVWSIPSGAIGEGETPEEGAKREYREEHGPLPQGVTHHHTVKSTDHGNWSFHTVVMDSPERFEPRGGGETGFEQQGAAWHTAAEVRGMKNRGELHPAFAESWDAVRRSRGPKEAAIETPLQMKPGLYYRLHGRDEPFGPEHAFTRNVGEPPHPDLAKYWEPKEGYSAFWNPHHLHQYLDEMHWNDPGELRQSKVIAFRGTPIGEGADGEPRVMPESSSHDSMSWRHFQNRLEITPNGYGRWHEHTWGDGPEGQQVDDGYRTIGGDYRMGTKTARATETKNSSAYRPATGSDRCGGCVMFREGKKHDWCTKVKGSIEADHVCRFFYAKPNSHRSHLWNQDRSKTAMTGYDVAPRTGMIYLDVPPELIHKVPDGVDDHHITVVYLGKGLSDEQFEEACRRAQEAASKTPPLQGTLEGTETFPPSESSEGRTPAFVPADVPGIEKLRGELEDLSASEHKDYTPHVTLAYLEDGDPEPPPHPAVEVRFTHLHVKRGDDIKSFPLGGMAKQADYRQPPTEETWQARRHRVSQWLGKQGDIFHLPSKWGPHTPNYVAHGLIADHDGPERDEHWEHLPDQEVSLRQPIHTHQGWVYTGTVKHYLDADADPDRYYDMESEQEPGGSDPKFVRHNGTHYLLDGHHRYAKDRLMGHESMYGKVFDTADPSHKQANCYECHRDEAENDYDHASEDCPACQHHGWYV